MVLLLLGCNSLSTPRGVPVDIRGLSSALWMKDRYYDAESEWAAAYVLLSSETVRCSTFREAAFTDTDGAIWEGDHVLVYLNWYYSPFDWEQHESGQTQVGWEGRYGAGVQVQELLDEGIVTRRMSLSLYDDGVRVTPETEVGVLELSFDSAIRGVLDHDSVDSRFTAEDCGEQGPDEYDTGNVW